MIILYLHHKRTLYIWSYSKPWLRDCCFPIPPPDDMVYDVFVSYSSDDRDFVEDTLWQQLEHGGQSSELRDHSTYMMPIFYVLTPFPLSLSDSCSCSLSVQAPYQLEYLHSVVN